MTIQKFAERVRMRMPASPDENCDDVPMKEMLQRTPLLWAGGVNAFPIKFAFWEGTSAKAKSAYYFGIHRIEKAVKAPFPLFKEVALDSGEVQIACGEEDFEDPEVDLDKMFSQPTPGFLLGGGVTGFAPAVEREMGSCHHNFNTTTGELGGCSLAIDREESLYVLGPIAMHELLHGLGIGHDRQTPGSIMYPTFGDVRFMGKRLARALRLLYGIPDPK